MGIPLLNQMQTIWNSNMNFKERTIDLEINFEGKVVSNSSALLFSNDDEKFLLSSKHSFALIMITVLTKM